MAVNNITIGLVNVIENMPNIATVNTEKCIFGGMLGRIYNSMIQDWATNCTIKLYHRLGDFNPQTGTWDGLLGGLQNNEFDIVPQGIPYPVLSMTNVKFTYQISQEPVVISCAYKQPENGTQIDIVELFFETLSLDYYFSILFSFIFFTLCWSIFQFKLCEFEHIKDQFKKNRLSSTWLNLCAFLDQDQFPSINILGFANLAVLISLFYWFMFDCWILNIIGSDLTVYKEPRVIRTLDDMRKYHVQAMFFENPENKHFQEAPDGTLERFIWDTGIAMGTNQITSIYKVMPGIMAQEIVSISRQSISIALAVFGIHISQQSVKTFRSFISYVSDLETSYSFAYQDHLSENFQVIFHQRMFQITESGLYRHIMIDQFIVEFGGSVIDGDQFVSTKLDMPDLPTPNVDIYQTYSLFILISCLFIISFFVLLLELSYHSLKKKISARKLKQTFVFFKRAKPAKPPNDT